MKLSEKSRQKIEAFFREYLDDRQFVLPEINFYGGRLTHYLTRALKIEGLTVGRRIYIFPENFWLSENQKLRLDEELVVHEIAHVLQYDREGFFRFLRLYVKSYYANLRRKEKRDLAARSQAYLDIPYEIEARRAASDFMIWSENRKFK
ncbi:MAG TPA: DUF4157 domain-containing protein [Pyrinomonadaceae bacterium]|jgi:hypothetical protein